MVLANEILIFGQMVLWCLSVGMDFVMDYGFRRGLWILPWDTEFRYGFWISLYAVVG
jgi:hypothetical protein